MPSQHLKSSEPLTTAKRVKVNGLGFLKVGGLEYYTGVTWAGAEVEVTPADEPGVIAINGRTELRPIDSSCCQLPAVVEARRHNRRSQANRGSRTSRKAEAIR